MWSIANCSLIHRQNVCPSFTVWHSVKMEIGIIMLSNQACSQKKIPVGGSALRHGCTEPSLPATLWARGITSGKILKFCAQNHALSCILARYGSGSVLPWKIHHGLRWVTQAFGGGARAPRPQPPPLATGLHRHLCSCCIVFSSVAMLWNFVNFDHWFLTVYRAYTPWDRDRISVTTRIVLREVQRVLVHQGSPQFWGPTKLQKSFYIQRVKPTVFLKKPERYN